MIEYILNSKKEGKPMPIQLYALVTTLCILIIFVYILTVLFALIFHRIRIIRLFNDISCKHDLLYLRQQDFYDIIMESYRRTGHKIRTTDKCGQQSGFVLDDNKFVEVWKTGLSQLIEAEAAMSFAKCMRSNNIYRGVLITLGDFKGTTLKFCKTNVIECINGDQLLNLIKEAQGIRLASEI